MLCFRCGYNNINISQSPGFCEKCNALLPEKEDNNSFTLEKSKTARLEKIINMAYEFIEDHCSAEIFVDFLEKQKQSFKKARSNMENLQIPKELLLEFAPQIKAGLKGIEIYIKAIEMMEENITGPEVSKENIIPILNMLKEGNKYINDCHTMSEEKLREIREEEPIY